MKVGDEKRQEVDRYRELFERSADAILILDGEHFIDCNAATIKMLRYDTKEELLQTHPSELSPEFQPDGRRSYDKANEMMEIAFERGSHRFEWDHRRADGEVFPVEVLLTAVPDGERHLLHVVWRDITNRKRLEDDLRHAQKMQAIGKLAGGIAHDFNNLLVVILGCAELLAADLEEGSEQRDHVKGIADAATRASELTSQLLAFSRKQVLRPEVIDLDAVLDNLCTILKRLIGEDIELRIEHGRHPSIVKADPGLIEQMILNLVANARDAMPDGGMVTLKTARSELPANSELELEPGSYVALTISDSGAGMEPEVVERAFEPFFTTKERGRGTGLGLASAYGTVRQSGGDMRIESSPGTGTTIEILLPPTTEPVRSVRAERPKEGDRRAWERVLVVEDEPAVSAIVRRVLKDQGYDVLVADNGVAALRMVSGSPVQIDFVITDVVMPAMSGPEMVKHLRAERPDLPVLFMSGYTDNALSEHGFSLDEVEILRKPFTAGDLIARVDRFLSTDSEGSPRLAT